MMLLVAVLSALITPNGSVAALVPVVVILAMRLAARRPRCSYRWRSPPSPEPLLVLTGSPVNVLVSEASDEAGAGGFGLL